MKPSELLERIVTVLVLLVTGWIYHAYGAQAATLAIGIAIFAGLFALLEELRLQAHSIKALIEERDSEP